MSITLVHEYKHADTFWNVAASPSQPNLFVAGGTCSALLIDTSQKTASASLIDFKTQQIQIQDCCFVPGAPQSTVALVGDDGILELYRTDELIAHYKSNPVSVNVNNKNAKKKKKKQEDENDEDDDDDENENGAENEEGDDEDEQADDNGIPALGVAPILSEYFSGEVWAVAAAQGGKIAVGVSGWSLQLLRLSSDFTSIEKLADTTDADEDSMEQIVGGSVDNSLSFSPCGKFLYFFELGDFDGVVVMRADTEGAPENLLKIQFMEGTNCDSIHCWSPTGNRFAFFFHGVQIYDIDQQTISDGENEGPGPIATFDEALWKPLHMQFLSDSLIVYIAIQDDDGSGDEMTQRRTVGVFNIALGRVVWSGSDVLPCTIGKFELSCDKKTMIAFGLRHKGFLVLSIDGFVAENQQQQQQHRETNGKTPKKLAGKIRHRKEEEDNNEENEMYE